MKKHILSLSALTLALGFASAHAAEYFVVVPVPAKLVALKDISVSLAGSSLPDGVIGNTYSFDLKSLLSVSGDPGYNGSRVSWSISSGSLPAGLNLSADGTLSGTPTAQSSSSFSVKATYKTKTGEQGYQILVVNIVVGLTGTTMPGAQVGKLYSYDLKPLLSVSGDPTYDISKVTWSTVSSSLPAGLSLRTDGTIAGTPEAGGTGTVVARATYKGFNGEQSYQVITLSINVSLAAATLPDAEVNQAYSFDLKPHLNITGDPAYTGANVAWSVVSSSLPAGIQLRSDGTIAGTPTATGTGTVVVRATYSDVHGEQSYQVLAFTLGATLPDVAFGSVAAGTPTEQVATLTNTGTKAVTLTAPTAASVTGTGFSFVSTTCGVTLPAGQNCTTTVRYTPTAQNAGTGALAINTSAGSKTAVLTGQSLQAVLTFNPTTYAFGDVVVGQHKTSTSITLTNSGNTDATGLTFTPTSGYSVDTTTCTTTLAAGASCNFTVKFAPTAVQSY